MEQIDFRHTDLTDGFWKNRQKTIIETSIDSVYRRFEETGRFSALRCDWKEGMENKPHIFWDSDIAKWIESASYIMEKESHPEWEKIIDEAAEAIAANQLPDGYFNSCYITLYPEKRWTERTDHELYCAGHLIEAAIAYDSATGKRRLLDIMEKYAEHIYNVFIRDKSASFTTPGHEEIELALIKLYRYTKNEKYLEMCRFFIDNRGSKDEQKYGGSSPKYSQSHLPVRQQRTAEGHSVRACYLYCGMADLAKETGDGELFNACEAIFDDIVNKKMYVTGGIGSSSVGEAFTLPYDLPNLTAYSESCASLALAWFAQRMTLLDDDSKYADAAERVLYNNALSAVSLDGKSFFYVNPLEIRTDILNRNTSQTDTRERLPETQRREVFSCSCCPPNITRFIASAADFMYTVDDGTLFVHQYMAGNTKFGDIKVSQETEYPKNGKIRITVGGVSRVAVRIPSWCENYSAQLNGSGADYSVKKGYAYIDLKGDGVLDLSFEMKPALVFASPDVYDCRGKAAVALGPVVYCAEGVDNDFVVSSFVLDKKPKFSSRFDEKLGAYTLTASGTVPQGGWKLYSSAPEKRVAAEIKLIPYFAFANRGETDMEVWLLHK